MEQVSNLFQNMSDSGFLAYHSHVPDLPPTKTEEAIETIRLRAAIPGQVRHLTPYHQKRHRLANSLVMGALGVQLASMLVASPFSVATANRIVMIGVALMMLLTLCGLGLMRRANAIVEREFVDSHGRMCVHCGRNLSELTPMCICPGCGVEFHLEHATTDWLLAGLALPSDHNFPPGSSLSLELRDARAQPPPSVSQLAYPPYFLRRTQQARRSAWLVFSLVTLLVTLPLIALMFVDILSMYTMIPAVLAPILSYLIVAVNGRSPVAREFFSARGRLCIHCGLDLNKMKSNGQCPGCGNAFDSVRDAQTWSNVNLVAHDRERV